MRRDITPSKLDAGYGIYNGIAAFNLYAIYGFSVLSDTDILRAGQRLKLSTSDVRSGLKVQIHIFLRTVVGHENRPVVMVDSVKRLLTQIGNEV